MDQEMRQDIREIRTVVAGLAVQVAGLSATFVTVAQFGELSKRVDLLAEAASRQRGGFSYLLVAINFAFALGALALAARGKMW